MIKCELIDEKFEQFNQALHAQARLYRILLSLTRKQAEKKVSENIESHIKLLEEKKAILRKIESLEFTNAALRYLWEAQNHRAETLMRTQIRLAIEENRFLLEELLESKAQQDFGLAEKLVNEKIRQLTAGARSFSSYKGRYQCKQLSMSETG